MTDWASAVEKLVAQIETTTDAEIVVVSASKSGGYLDLALGAAAVATLLVLVGAILVPFTLHPIAFVVLVGLAFPVLAWMFHSPWFVRPLAGADRRARQVREAACAEFVKEAVHGTPNRTGVLVYRSELEGLVEVVVDFGVEGKIPKGELDVAIQGMVADEAAFLRGLEALGALLAQRVPATADSDKFDMPNAPRIRS